jgi:hypothetical protein
LADGSALKTTFCRPELTFIKQNKRNLAEQERNKPTATIPLASLCNKQTAIPVTAIKKINTFTMEKKFRTKT